MKSTVAVFLAAVFTAASVNADEIELSNGNVIEGTIVEENEERVVIETEDGRLTIPKSQIASITRARTSEPAKPDSPPPNTARRYDGETFTRKLKAERAWEIQAEPGLKTMAAVPLIMSFWGSTNEQVIESERLRSSEPPDTKEVVFDFKNSGCRSLVMTWESPKGGKIIVVQHMDISISCRNTLYTMAKLPYPEETKKALAYSLAADSKGGINPANPDFAPICDEPALLSGYAEAAVEAVCEWINRNVAFESGKSSTSDTTFKDRTGNCVATASLACAMLRRMGIPSETVSAVFAGFDSGHCFIEVYYPDAGWVFYDLSKRERGFKYPECLVTAGWSYLVATPKSGDWKQGFFLAARDEGPFKALRDLPEDAFETRPGGLAWGAKVRRIKPPAGIRVRHRSIRETMSDLGTPPGKREYAQEHGR